MHELSHAIEQQVRSTEADLLERWAVAAASDGTPVLLPFNSQDVHEDMAEFGVVFAVAMKTNQLNELQTESPERFNLWEHTLNQVAHEQVRQVKLMQLAEPFGEFVSTDLDGKLTELESAVRELQATKIMREIDGAYVLTRYDDTPFHPGSSPAERILELEAILETLGGGNIITLDETTNTAGGG